MFALPIFRVIGEARAARRRILVEPVRAIIARDVDMAGPRIAVVAAHLLHDLRRRVEAVTVGDVLRGPGDMVRQRIEAPRHVIDERRRQTGRAAWGEKVCQSVDSTEAEVSYKQKTK